MPSNSESWGLYRGTGSPGTGAQEWPRPPGWRDFGGGPDLPAPPSDDPYASVMLGAAAQPLEPVPQEVDRVNTALHLCRPLLVTGEPGTGKSSLAFRISRELGLGRVLRWQITSLSTLREGLYAGDARLGPLGTAFLPHRSPRVLLIDRLDRAEIALPEDLCTVLSAGGFSLPGAPTGSDSDAAVRMATEDGPAVTVPLSGGAVRCHAFPVVVITTSGDRDLPFDLVRRCVILRTSRPSPGLLRAIAATRFPVDGPRRLPAPDVVDAFLECAARADGPVVERFLDALQLAADGVLRIVSAQGRSRQEAVNVLWQWTAPEEL
ncbi:MoxR family ATPase [Streptomyces sp. NBC_00878]|uniref:MoxR family ATPase n=1 Tax=Streptomyces sp. NBC_00878 TaxID=2975854 RepID=UPI00225A71CE|nr:MoxR family ATPase [Streptomyces sp. NBC_00878]MCX4906272.1 MoxR family ATPase [Streptomyces sp. NBC_00878]